MMTKDDKDDTTPFSQDLHVTSITEEEKKKYEITPCMLGFLSTLSKMTEDQILECAEEIRKAQGKKKSDLKNIQWPYGTKDSLSPSEANKLIHLNPKFAKAMYLWCTCMGEGGNCTKSQDHNLISTAGTCLIPFCNLKKIHFALPFMGMNKLCYSATLGAIYHAICEGYYFLISVDQKMKNEGSRHTCISPVCM